MDFFPLANRGTVSPKLNIIDRFLELWQNNQNKTNFILGYIEYKQKVCIYSFHQHYKEITLKGC